MDRTERIERRKESCAKSMKINLGKEKEKERKDQKTQCKKRTKIIIVLFAGVHCGVAMSVQRERRTERSARKEHRWLLLSRATRSERKNERRKRRKEALLNKRQGNISDLTPGRDNDVRIPFASASFEREAIVPPLFPPAFAPPAFPRPFHDPPRYSP